MNTRPTSKPTQTVVAFPPPARQSERQRGLWSFVTWSFFLPQLLAGDPFFATHSNAAQDHQDEVASRAAPNDSVAAVDNQPSSVPGAVTTADGVGADETSIAHPNSYAAHSVLILDNTQQGSTTSGPKPSSDDAQPAASGGGDGGSDPSDSSGLDVLDQSVAPDSDQALPTGGIDVSTLGLNLDLTSLHPDYLLELDAQKEQSETNHPKMDLQADHVISDSSGFRGGVLDPNLSGLEPELPQPLPLIPEVDFNQLLGLDLRLSTDSILAGVDISPAVNLNAVGLISDLANSLGLTAGVDFNHFVDLDVRLSTAGSSVGVDGALTSLLSSDHLTSTVGQAVALTTGLDLTDLLSSGSGSVAGLLGFAARPTGDSPLPSITSTLADVTGVQMFGHLDGLSTQLLTAPDSSANATPVSAVHASTGLSGDDVTSGPLLPHILSDLTDVGGLQHNGDISSGGALNFPAQTPAPVDDLFSGDRYTEYHVTLQSPSQNIGDLPGTLHTDVLVHADASPPATDTPSNQHEPSALPPIEHPIDASLANSVLPLSHLNSH